MKLSTFKIENVHSRCGIIKELKIIPFPVENSCRGRDYFGNSRKTKERYRIMEGKHANKI